MELTRRWVAPTLLIGGIEMVKALLQGECKWLSSALKVTLSRKAVWRFALSCPLWVAGLVLVSDGVREYLWGAACLLAAWRLARPLLSEFSNLKTL